jgi:hypothetical protein
MMYPPVFGAGSPNRKNVNKRSSDLDTCSSRLKRMRLNCTYGDLCLSRDLQEMRHNEGFIHKGLALERRQPRVLLWKLRPNMVCEVSIPRNYPHRPPTIRILLPHDRSHFIVCQDRPDPSTGANAPQQGWSVPWSPIRRLKDLLDDVWLLLHSDRAMPDAAVNVLDKAFPPNRFDQGYTMDRPWSNMDTA